jgi:hypothetical protein
MLWTAAETIDELKSISEPTTEQGVDGVGCGSRTQHPMNIYSIRK